MLLFEQRVHSWVLLQRSRQATHLQEGGSGKSGSEKGGVCCTLLLVRLPWVEEVQLEAKLRTHAGTYTHQGKVPFPGRVWLKPTTCSAIAFNLLHPCAARPVPAFIIRATRCCLWKTKNVPSTILPRGVQRCSTYLCISLARRQPVHSAVVRSRSPARTTKNQKGPAIGCKLQDSNLVQHVIPGILLAAVPPGLTKVRLRCSVQKPEARCACRHARGAGGRQTAVVG